MTLVPPQAFRKVEFIHRVGLAANRPAAADVLIGTLYFSTDTGVLERSDGINWTAYAGSGGGGGTPAGTDGAIQFNDGGVLGAELGFEYAKGPDFEIKVGNGLRWHNHGTVRSWTEDDRATGSISLAFENSYWTDKGPVLQMYGNNYPNVATPEAGYRGCIDFFLADVVGSQFRVYLRDGTTKAFIVDGTTGNATFTATQTIILPASSPSGAALRILSNSPEGALIELRDLGTLIDRQTGYLRFRGGGLTFESINDIGQVVEGWGFQGNKFFLRGQPPYPLTLSYGHAGADVPSAPALAWYPGTTELTLMRFDGTARNVFLAAGFGDTPLNASQLTSGTVPDARLVGTSLEARIAALEARVTALEAL